MANKIKDTSILIRIQYTNEQYSKLLHTGEATAGDIVICSSAYPYGTLNTQGQTFYFYNPNLEDERLLTVCDGKYISYDENNVCSPSGLHLYTDFVGVSKIGILDINDNEQPYITLNVDTSTHQSQVRITDNIGLFAPSLYTTIGYNERQNVGNTISKLSSDLTTLNVNKVDVSTYNLNYNFIDVSLINHENRLYTIESSINANWDADKVFQQLVADASSSLSNKLLEIEEVQAEKFTGYDTSIKDLVNKVNTIEIGQKTQTTTFNKKFTLVDSSIKTINSSINLLGTMLFDDVSVRVKHNKQDIQRILSQITTLEEIYINPYGETLNQHDTKLNKLAADISTAYDNINTHEEKIKNIQQTEADLDSSLSILYTTVNNLITNEGNIDTAYVDQQIYTLDSSLKIYTDGQIESVKTLITNTNTQFANYVAIDKYNSNNEILIAALYQLNNQYNEALETISELSMRIDDLENSK